MNLFKRKSTKPCWKDEHGNIRCLGDDCKTICDNTCPIWLNTQGVNCMMRNNPSQAVSFLEKAVEIEPNFESIYNNLAAAYGMSGKYQDAINAYTKKLEFDPEDNDAIYGIAVSYKNLEQFEKALELCEQYENLFGLDERIKKVKELCLGIEKEEYIDPIALCLFMLEEDKKDGLIDYRGGFPNIPELVVQKDSVCNEILNALEDYAKEHNKLFRLCGAWSAYAGIGAVYLWNDDWNSLREKGIYNSLTEPRGIEEMDEYVTMLLGWEFGGEESSDLRGSLEGWGIYLEEELCGDGFDENTFQAFLHAMYIYGVVYGMSQLGMH